MSEEFNSQDSSSLVSNTGEVQVARDVGSNPTPDIFNLSEKRKKFKPLVNMALTSLKGQAQLDFILNLFDEVEEQDKEFTKLLKEDKAPIKIGFSNRNYFEGWMDCFEHMKNRVNKLSGHLK